MAATVIQLEADLLEELDLNEVSLYMDWNDKLLDFLNEKPGKEAYKLIAYLSSFFKKCACVLTGNGLNVMALIYACEDITTYDYFDHIPEDASMSIRNVDAVNMKQMNCLYDIDNLIKNDFIVISTSPHDGLYEKEIFEALLKNGYKGVLLLDSIKLTPGLSEFWSSIQLPKWDLSHLGHWTGTGLVVFDPDLYQIKFD